MDVNPYQSPPPFDLPPKHEPELMPFWQAVVEASLWLALAAWVAASMVL
jgi:hypothetical protein